MYRILVVLTGGTIGSVCENGVRNLNGDSSYLLLREFRRRCPEYSSCEFDVINPYSILSENLDYSCWEKLYSALVGADISAYDGVIVAHGSDTLSYTAAALGYLMRHTHCPIVLTASDRPVDDKESNAIVNFRSAVDFIINSGLRGVFVAYRRGGERPVNAIYLATRLREADCFRGEFTSYGGGMLGEIKDGEFLPTALDINPTHEEMNEKFSPIAPDEIHLDKKIMMLFSYPGMDYSAVDPSGFAAVLNCGYHSATACTSGKSTSLEKFADRCNECGVDLWLGSFNSAENEVYATNDLLLKMGVKPFFDMSWEAAYAKAVLAYNISKEPEKFMREEIYFEQLKRSIYGRYTKRKA